MLRSASGIGPAALAGEQGAGIYLPSRLNPSVWTPEGGRSSPRPTVTTRTTLQHGAGKGLEFNLLGGSGPGPAPTWHGDRDRAASGGLPQPGNLRP